MGCPAFAAGDAEEIAEASAAMFSGKIKGLEIARYLGYDVGIIPDEWYRTFDILKSKPGMVTKEIVPEMLNGVMPIIHCSQEIPCDPCSTVCPRHLIYIDKSDIRHLPQYTLGDESCAGCERCVTFCPGLAITLVDFRKEPDSPTVSIPLRILTRQFIGGSGCNCGGYAGFTLGKSAYPEDPVNQE